MATSNCGNEHIDNLATVGRRMAVWDRLAHKFPMVAEHAEEIWLARRDGRVRRKIEADPRFHSIRNPDGPATEAEWELLAHAALEAIGKGLGAGPPHHLNGPRGDA